MQDPLYIAERFGAASIEQTVIFLTAVGADNNGGEDNHF
jgi:hypothetical protein